MHLFEDNPSTASWVAQSLSSVADRIKAASHVLPAEVQTVLQDGVDGPAVIIQESTAGGVDGGGVEGGGDGAFPGQKPTSPLKTSPLALHEAQYAPKPAMSGV